ncbi:hypothetical protein ANO11243_053440 [Dothideomycetidae sp. 11243]|nr:hypothetical protein ANO11243_053440 [fungal sp. No.11243]
MTKVADVATGNGIWLHDFARDKPASIELHGFDISLDQVGPSPWLPANIRMHIWNIFEEPPAQFVGYFDIVHVRLITVVIKQNDPRPALKNLWKLLSMSDSAAFVYEGCTNAEPKSLAGICSGMK